LNVSFGREEKEGLQIFFEVTCSLDWREKSWCRIGSMESELV